MTRNRPNIIITGTPGVGKTSHCELLAAQTDLQHLRINRFVQETGCHEGWDEEYMSWIVDEDKLLDHLEDAGVGSKGGNIIDWHACDVFPESWIDLVVVLRTNSAVLYDRLEARQYKEKKLRENMDCEIWGLLLEEAREGFDPNIVIELTSEKTKDIDENIERIEQWVSTWIQNHQDQDK